MSLVSFPLIYLFYRAVLQEQIKRNLSIGEGNTLGNSGFSSLLLLGHQQPFPFVTYGFSDAEIMGEILLVGNARASGCLCKQ